MTKYKRLSYFDKKHNLTRVQKANAMFLCSSVRKGRLILYSEEDFYLNLDKILDETIKCKYCKSSENLREINNIKYRVCKKCFSERLSNKMSMLMKNEFVKKQISISVKKNWSHSEDRRTNLSRRMIDSWQTVEFNEMMSSKIKKSKKVIQSNIISKHISKYNSLSDVKEVAKTKRFSFVCSKCHNSFQKSWSNVSNFHANMICSNCVNSGMSNEEKKVLEFVKSIYKREIQSNVRILKLDEDKRHNREIDIYLPDEKLGIEYNGLYYHTGDNTNVHLYKTELAEKLGIRLIHINTNDWFEKTSIIKNILKQVLRKTTHKIFAKKCKIQEIDSKQSNEFLEKNHLQGRAQANIRLGLFYKDILVQVMTFGKSRYDKTYDYELIRLATKLDYNVIGGANRLLKYFEKTYKPKSLISYCDRAFFAGSIYLDLGFSFSHNTTPNYFYTKDNYTLESRQKYMKHLLKDKLEIYDDTLTENENMKANGYLRYYNCGNKVFKKNNYINT